MAAEVSITTVTENSTQSTTMSPSGASSSSPMAGEEKISTSSIIYVAKEAVKKRVKAASAALKHAENLDAIVKASELAAAAVSQAGIIVSIGNHLPIRELVDSGPLNYWSTLHVYPEWGAKAHIDQSKTPSPEKLVPAEPPKAGANIMGESVNPGTVTSIRKNSSRTQICHRASDTARTIDTVPESFCGTNSEAVASGNAYKTASGTAFENGMVEGCLVEVFKGGGTCREAWYLAKILNLKDGKAFVCYTDLQTSDGSEELKEWVPLNGDGLKAPTVRTALHTTSMGFDGTRKRRRAAVMDYTWCVGDRVDAWIQNCWLEGFVKEKNKDDETTLTIYFPALRGTLPRKIWHLRPASVWQDGKWIECPPASRKSPSKGDTPQEKRAKTVHLAMDAAKEKDKIVRGDDIVDSKQLEESRPLPLSNEKEFDIGMNTRDNILNRHHAATGLQKEGSKVVFGVPKPGKKQKFIDLSKHLDSDQSSKITKTSDSIKNTRNFMLQGSGGRSWNNKTTVDNKEKQTAENKTKALSSGQSQSILGGAVPQKITSLVSAKSTDKVIEENNSVIEENNSVIEENSSGQQGLGEFGSGGKLGKKVELGTLFSQIAEPRRSVGKIQPTSRLLEGLQSSLFTSKLPSQHKINSKETRTEGI